MVIMTAALCGRSNFSVTFKLAEKKGLLDSLPGYVGDAGPNSPIGRPGVGKKI